MSSSTQTEHDIHIVNGDDRIIVPSPTPQGEWTIICPTCERMHRSAARLCPHCTYAQFRIRDENNERLRQFIDHIRSALIVSWHEQAINMGHKNPLVFVETKWREVVKEYGL